MEKVNNKKIILLMLLSSIFWAGAFIGGKLAVEEFPPFSLTFLRFLFASIIIFFVMVKYEKKDWHLKREDYPVMIFLGLVGMVGYHILFFIALKHTTAINASMIAAINPLLTTILAAIFLGEGLGFARMGAIIIALMGVIITITRGDFSIIKNLNFNIGDMLMIVAVSCWAVYSIVSRRVMSKYSPLILTCYSFILCTIFTLPFALLERPSQFLSQTTILGWSSVLYMAIFPSTIGYLVQQTSIKEIGPSRTAIFINLVPVFSMVLSVIILKERITFLTLIGGIMILSGVYLTTKLKNPNYIYSEVKVSEKS
ncbi:DMT family transporter [Alkaliphilus peptidifermentans]|uniref:Permease of the drug/metabolite transporter (DMT) superfamily n=1 Tax=Alkaliphilus peptidifermentans DSM 18978 TaxID=1120976 RepID=A0A1G5HZX9_9FIRM|nr:DMT family transporter [Alkaliphilus peptidifermentans]SCY69353.1 Permease of the drug/metabolite transporter (DMT) superfamily [Alkaliphilus peptidifermentans DSM 18978]